MGRFSRVKAEAQSFDQREHKYLQDYLQRRMKKYEADKITNSGARFPGRLENSLETSSRGMLELSVSPWTSAEPLTCAMRGTTCTVSKRDDGWSQKSTFVIWREM
jgi:hypothetical protein